MKILRIISIIAAAIALSSCGNLQEDLTPAEALIVRLEGQIGQGRIMFGHQDTSNETFIERTKHCLALTEAFAKEHGKLMAVTETGNEGVKYEKCLRRDYAAPFPRPLSGPRLSGGLQGFRCTGSDDVFIMNNFNFYDYEFRAETCLA